MAQRILAIDPGSEQSAFCFYEKGKPEFKDIVPNSEMLNLVRKEGALKRMGIEKTQLAVEMIASYGMPVGKEVFETCVWIGRFLEAWMSPGYRLVYRKDVKMHLCGNMRAKDSNIRQALIDKFGPMGTKKAPGVLYGFKADMWSALAVAVTAAETKSVSP